MDLCQTWRGKNQNLLKNFRKKFRQVFLRFEYSGHGKSSNKLTEGNISKWTDDARQLINSKINKKKLFSLDQAWAVG